MKKFLNITFKSLDKFKDKKIIQFLIILMFLNRVDWVNFVNAGFSINKIRLKKFKSNKAKYCILKIIYDL